jgi:hypothetical protein
MTLNKLKQIRNELKQNAEIYDEAFKNTAMIAAEELGDKQNLLDNRHKIFKPILDKKYFLERYGNLITAKQEYKKIYRSKDFGKSWDDFLNAVKELPLMEQPIMTLEQRIQRIENILSAMGYEL